MKHIIGFSLLFMLLSATACAQTSPGFAPNTVLTASALNTAIAAKVDYNASSLTPRIFGTPTPSNCVKWFSPTQIQDAGAACGSGGGATPPGGSNGQIQFNNSGAFGGVSVVGSNNGGAGTVSGILKANGAGVVSAAVAGTDYAAPTSGASLLYGDGAGGFANATIGSGLTFSAGTLAATGGGTGTVTSVATGAGLTGGPITTTGTISATQAINAQAGTTYTVLAGDNQGIVTLSNSSAIAVTVPQATSSFGAGWATTICDIGAGTATLTPTTSTINGAATYTLQTGNCVSPISDGANYQVIPYTGQSFAQAKLIQYTQTYSAAGTPLPTCNTAAKGTTGMVSDATTPTYLGTYTSGGAVFAPVVCTGSAWETY